MSTGTYVPVTCAGCGQPILDACFTWTGAGMYHNHCRPPGYVLPAAAPITADLLRIIVREEVGRLFKEHGFGVKGPDHG